MLYSSVLELRSREESILPGHYPYQGYGLVLSLLRRSAPRIAEAVHNAAVKPLAVAVLGPPWPVAPAPRRVRAGDVLRVRVACLRDDVFAALAEAVLSHARGEPVELGEARFDIVRLATTPAETRWAGCVGVEDLLARAEPSPALRLRFFTPTTFRSKGRRNVMFPEPELLVRGYARRWRQAGGPSVSPELEDTLVQRTIVARYSLRSGMVDFGHYAESGFVGTCELRIVRSRDDNLSRTLQALGSFAGFAGTGAKTAMGLGLTARATDGHPLRERARRATEDPAGEAPSRG